MVSVDRPTSPGTGPLVSRAQSDPHIRRLLEDSSVTNVDCARLLGVYESSVRRWRAKNGVHNRNAYSAGRDPEPATTTAPLTAGQRAKLHDRLDLVMDGINAEAGEVKGLRVSQWENVMRGPDNEPVVTQLQGIKLDVKVNELAPEWPLIDRPAVTFRVIPPGEPRPPHPRDQVAVILPDPQIGYRQFENGELDPFHDEAAIDVAMQVVADLKPQRTVCLGDFQDFAEFGRFTQEAAFARTTQAGINRGHEWCAQLRAADPDGEHDIMEGNHDRRAEARILENNKASWGLRRAADTTGWPVFSVPYLCAFDLFGIRYVQGYPAGELWLTDELRCIHGYKVRSSGSTAAAVVRDDGVSTIFGHVHRIELQYLTRRVRGSGHRILAATPGCLCRVDGAVPSAKGATDLSGRPVDSAENWQQGLAIVEYRQGKPAFHLTLAHIDTHNGYETHVFGRTYLPRKKRR